jgi:hypothetical protein
VEEYCRAVQIMDDIRFAGWINMVTDTKSEFVIIIAFLRQQCLRKRTSMFRYTYIASRVDLSHHTSFMTHDCFVASL